VPADIAEAFRSACRAELDALKPGNVHRFADGHGMSVAQFAASAAAAAPCIARAGAPVGERIYAAVAASLAAVGCNTNLGIVLLAAPLAVAAERAGEPARLRAALAAVLAALEVADAEAAFAAIRLANPGGLGEAARHDVREPARVTLLEAMREAAPRDSIARQYASGFADVFDLGLPALRAALARGWKLEWATTLTYLEFLAAFPDSHIARKDPSGPLAHSVTTQARTVREALASAAAPEPLVAQLMAWDAELKAAGLNPGTSADLTVATLFAHRLAA